MKTKPIALLTLIIIATSYIISCKKKETVEPAAVAMFM